MWYSSVHKYNYLHNNEFCYLGPLVLAVSSSQLAMLEWHWGQTSDSLPVLPTLVLQDNCLVQSCTVSLDSCDQGHSFVRWSDGGFPAPFPDGVWSGEYFITICFDY